MKTAQQGTTVFELYAHYRILPEPLLLPVVTYLAQQATVTFVVMDSADGWAVMVQDKGRYIAVLDAAIAAARAGAST